MSARLSSKSLSWVTNIWTPRMACGWTVLVRI